MSEIERVLARLSQRELRNESGRVLRAVAEGESFILTNSGVPVGVLAPVGTPGPGLPITRHAKRQGGWGKLGIKRKTIDRGLAGLIDDLRRDRV